MPKAFVSLDPTELPIGQVYDLLVTGVQPRPIAFVSSLSADGTLNLAPFSFFMAGGANPPSLVYSPTLNKAGEKKDSLRNVEASGEFVVNMVTREMATGMNAASYEFPVAFSEWDVAGFHPMPSEVVSPPRVCESPVQFECRVFQIVRHGTGAAAACYVIGEVVRIHVDQAVWTGESIDPELFRPISRMGGPNYLDTNSLEIFSLARPTAAAETSIQP